MAEEIDLRDLGDVVAAAVERGFVARLPPTLEPHSQRLLATLGLPVLFVDDADLPEFLAAPPPPSRSRWTVAQALLDELADGRSRSTGELWRAIGSTPQGVKKPLRLLVADGSVERLSRGVYRRR